MDTRDELHAVLDELDSDELPAPEAFRRALRRARPDFSNDLIDALLKVADARLELAMSEQAGRYVAAVAPLDQSGTVRSSTASATEQEPTGKRSRRLPQSLAIGKNGPPDLSEREGFAPIEDGRPR